MWDYALKYCHTSCQSILQEYMDKKTMSGSDDEKEKFISIFGTCNILS